MLDESLLRMQKIQAIRRPSKRSQKSVANFIYNTGSQAVEESDWIRIGPDLAAVAHDQEHGWLIGFIEDTLMRISKNGAMVSFSSFETSVTRSQRYVTWKNLSLRKFTWNMSHWETLCGKMSSYELSIWESYVTGNSPRPLKYHVNNRQFFAVPNKRSLRGRNRSYSYQLPDLIFYFAVSLPSPHPLSCSLRSLSCLNSNPEKEPTWNAIPTARSLSFLSSRWAFRPCARYLQRRKGRRCLRLQLLMLPY